MEKIFSENNSNLKGSEKILEKFKETVDKIKSIEDFDPELKEIKEGEKEEGLKYIPHNLEHIGGDIIPHNLEHIGGDIIPHILEHIVGGINPEPDDTRAQRYPNSFTIDEETKENLEVFYRNILSECRKLTLEEQYIASYIEALRYRAGEKDNSEIAKLSDKIKSELDMLELLDYTFRKFDFSMILPVLISKIIKGNPTPKNKKLCMSALDKFCYKHKHDIDQIGIKYEVMEEIGPERFKRIIESCILTEQYRYLEGLLNGVIGRISNKQIPYFMSDIIETLEFEQVSNDKICEIFANLIENNPGRVHPIIREISFHYDDDKELYLFFSQLSEKCGDVEKRLIADMCKILDVKYGIAEKSATVASGTSSGNTLNEEYEDLSRPSDPGVARLPSSSGTEAEEIPGQKTKESDSLFEDNELAEDLKRMFSEDESEKTALPKKEGVVSGSESQDKEKGRQQKLLELRNEKQSGVAPVIH